MKNFALTNLIVSIAIKSVSACTAVVGDNVAEKNATKVFNYLVISSIFFFGTIALYQFMKNRGGLIPMITAGVTLFLSWYLSDTSQGDCGDRAVENSQIGAAITSVCFVAQFTIWLLFRKKSHAELS